MRICWIFITLVAWVTWVDGGSTCIIIAQAGQRTLAKCKSMPTPDEWRAIVGNRTQRLFFENIESGYLMVPEMAKSLSVQELSMKSMKLDAIEEGFFSSLGLELNTIIMENVELSKPLTRRHFRGLENQLESLKILKCSKTRIEPDALDEMKKLKNLDLRHLAIREPPSNFETLLSNGLKTIDLSGTKIQTLPWAAIIHWSKGDVGATGTFTFEKSVLHCDESTIRFRNLLSQNDEKAKFYGFQCASPDEFRGRPLKDIPVEELQGVSVAPPMLTDSPNDDENANNFISTETPDGEAAPANKAAFSMVAVSVLAGIVAFIVLIIVTAIVIKYARNKHHTSVKKENDPSKDPMLGQQTKGYNNNNNNNNNNHEPKIQV